jgi:hypothetical protein
VVHCLLSASVVSTVADAGGALTRITFPVASVGFRVAGVVLAGATVCASSGFGLLLAANGFNFDKPAAELEAASDNVEQPDKATPRQTQTAHQAGTLK